VAGTGVHGLDVAAVAIGCAGVDHGAGGPGDVVDGDDGGGWPRNRGEGDRPTGRARARLERAGYQRTGNQRAGRQRAGYQRARRLRLLAIPSI
jgi:hypothetical protein